ncbi:MAG: MAPEG family protein [Archangiaceae bacterium]|nr:MAPEG family protein [Archangiaceae bacterium]
MNLPIVTLAGPLAVTLGYVVVYYLSMMNVLRVKTALSREYQARGETFDRYATHDKRMLAADRVQLNTLEHMPPFLVLLWLDATLASAPHASVLGGVYLLTRCIYPFMVGRALGGEAPRGIGRVIGISYLMLALFAVDLVVALVRALEY